MTEITKNKKPLVSVNMVSFNSEKYIAESIQSILNQTYKNFELIIVNDGSTDNTLREINNFNDSRIVIINNIKSLDLSVLFFLRIFATSFHVDFIYI